MQINLKKKFSDLLEQGTAALLGPPAAGALVEWRQSPAASLHFTAGLMFTAAVCFVFAAIHNR